MACPDDNDGTLPQQLYYKDCKPKSKKYKHGLVVIEQVPCPAHSEAAHNPLSSHITCNEEDVQKETFFTEKIKGLTEGGMSLPDAIRLMSLTEAEFIV